MSEIILIISHTILLVFVLVVGIQLIDENNNNEFQQRLTYWFFNDFQTYHTEQMKKMDKQIRIKTMENNFYNTINLQGLELMAEIDGVKKQSDKIMIYFNNNPGKEFTPFEVLNVVFNGRTPITSVRRSMSDLTAGGKLTKTNNQKILYLR